ncbi:hypothetical protein ACP3W1_27100, partial [Salmonella enterica]|uniref:hypothetical protein n=1 Tax=Salmonella enterica TaxID=28901 RepID=UPI003CFB220E
VDGAGTIERQVTDAPPGSRDDGVFVGSLCVHAATLHITPDGFSARDRGRWGERPPNERYSMPEGQVLEFSGLTKRFGAVSA